MHLRDQFVSKRLGLIFGAGLSASFGFPEWSQLVASIASDPKIKGKKLQKDYARFGLPYQTEMLFQHFRHGERRKIKKEEIDRKFDFDVHAKWRKILWTHLYKNVKKITRQSVKGHPYLESFLSIIRHIPVTVTYNFDDALEQALHETRTSELVGSSRGYLAVTNGALQLRGRGPVPVIYHPNGFIPRASLMETPSDRLIFSEHSYADHLVDLLSGDRSRLVTYLTDHTCLCVGVSLQDQGVRNLLRQCAKSNPGNYHYLIDYVPPRSKVSAARRDAAVQTNFRVYNLVTLFLKAHEIAALASLVSMKEEDFCDLAESNGVETKYCFYLTGALGVGKSTAIASLGSLNTFDEWLEPRLPVLAKLWSTLTPAEETKADQWIVRQFKLKNDNVRKKKSGLFVLDRGPLDPLAFTPAKKWSEKASSLLSTICPDASSWEVERGCVVLLRGDHEEMSLRLRLTSRTDYTAEKLRLMQEALQKAYGGDSVVHLDATGLSPAVAVNKIAELIYLEKYKPMDLHARLKYIQRKGRVP